MSGGIAAAEGISFRKRAEKVAEAIGVASVHCVGDDVERYVDFLLGKSTVFPVEDARPVDAWLHAKTLSTPADIDAFAVAPEGERPARLVVVATFGPGLVALLSSCGTTVRERIENALIAAGWRKHPASCYFADYETVGNEDGELIAVFEPVSDVSSRKYPMGTLLGERDLHMDMLREAGVRSDAHVVRYEWAASLIRPGDRVLDAACGMGYGAHVLAMRSSASAVLGLDGSLFAVEYARCNYGSARVAFEAGDLPSALRRHEDGSFDCIVSFETLEHVSEPEALLAEFHRLLVPGGRILVSVPNDWADESGEDPNPHHLHVYTWDKLREQVSERFIPEKAIQQIASGCKSGTPRVWREAPRKFAQASMAEAPRCDAEWWLMSAVKSPLSERPAIFRDASQAEFEGATSLVDFAGSYANPWLLRSMIEIPYRLQAPDALLHLALAVQKDTSRDTPDYGGALAVEGYRLLEDKGGRSSMADWLSRCDIYLDGGSVDPHRVRWSISLLFLCGAMRARIGDFTGAEAAYARCFASDFLRVTPTLGTKIVESAFRAGLIAYSQGRQAAALDAWAAGLRAADDCMKQDIMEFLGNRASPYEFAMNDLIEIVDGATRCASAIKLASGDRCAAGMLLAGLPRRSLRAAIARLSDDLLSAHEKAAGLEGIVRAKNQELDSARSEADAFRHLAEFRLSHIREIERAFSALESVSIRRLGEIERLSAELDSVRMVSLERMEEARMLDAALGEARSLAEQRGRAFAETDRALGEAQALVEERGRAFAETDRALGEAQALAESRGRALAETERALAEARASLQHQAAETARLNGLVSELDAHAARLSKQLHDISATLFYRLGRALRLLPQHGSE